MSDPHDRYPIRKLRGSLEWIREHEGEPVLSQELRSRVPGFKVFRGIYRPAGLPYALWIRQTRRGVYADRDPVIHPDGSWTYLYSPESQLGKTDEDLATNQGLQACKRDRIPVGVFRQVPDLDGKTAYRVLGLGFVEDFDGQHFIIRGEPINETAEPLPKGVVPPFHAFEFSRSPVQEVVRKLRERRFTSMIRQLYHEKCSLCEIALRVHGRPIALEAAHVVPVNDHGVIGDVRNGVLLCSNHHAMFDSYAWTFDEDYRVIVTEEREFRESAAANHVLSSIGQRLPNLPESESNYPGKEAIHWRLEHFEKHQ